MESKKLTVLLWVLVLISAFSVIQISFKARQDFFEWQLLQKEAQQLDVEWGQLLIEKSMLSSFSRLEAVATEQLKMSAPKTEQIIIIDPQGLEK